MAFFVSSGQGFAGFIGRDFQGSVLELVDDDDDDDDAIPFFEDIFRSQICFQELYHLLPTCN